MEMINLKEQIISYVMNAMYDALNGEQLKELKSAMYAALINVDIQSKKHELMVVDNSWKDDVAEFLMNKRIGGCSDKTIRKYEEHLFKLLSYFNKDISKIEDSDIYNYMNIYQEIRKISNRSLENMRLVFSSFFTWAQNHKKITVNPMIVISKIKTNYKLRTPFSDVEMELLLCNCNNYRDSALIEFLYCTCVRVGEVVLLDIKDVKFSDKELIVYGKGGKERSVYINAKTSVHLRKYLDSRKDNNPALFVSTRKPYGRLSISGVESIVKRIGKRAGVEEVYPHKFRRTGATNALNRGMPIQEVSALLGHENIATTQLYCIVDKKSVKDRKSVV